jgi:hypothetical protein
MKTFYEYLKEVWHDPTMPGYDYDNDPMRAVATQLPRSMAPNQPKRAVKWTSHIDTLSTGGGRKDMENSIIAAMQNASPEALVKANRILMRGQV